MPQVIPGISHTACVISCICLLALYSGLCYHRITALINENFPSARLEARETQLIYDIVCAQRPEWVQPLQRVGPMDPVVAGCLRLLAARAMRGRILPLELECYEGPLLALERLLDGSGIQQ